MARPAPDDWVPLAAVGRPHGIRGELRAHPFDKGSKLLLELDEVLVRFDEGERAGQAHEVSIDGARAGNDAILLKLHDVDDRDKAEGVRGALLCAKRRDFPPLEAGEFYACDIVGATVVDLDGTDVGVVRELTSYPSVDVLVVEGKLGRYEVPVVDAHIESVDVNAGRVVLRSLADLEPTT